MTAIGAGLDLLISGGRIWVSEPGSPGRLVEADLGVVGSRIVSIGDRPPTSAETVVVDAGGCLVIPGFVNAHTHSYAATSPGLGADAPLDVLIPAARASARASSDEQHYRAAYVLATSLLRSGITTVLDQPAQGVANPDATARAYEDVGIRAFVAPMVSDVPYGPWLGSSEVKSDQPVSTEAVLDGIGQFVNAWNGRSRLVTPMLGPFAPGVCSDALLEGAHELATRHGLPMHTHLAEAEWQAQRSTEIQGRRLVARLDALGLLGPSFSMAHAIWLDDDEIGLLADAGASIVHNALSNLMLGSGIAPLDRLRQAGVGIALGTDGLNCGCVADFFEHMRLSVAVHRPGTPYAAWPGAADALTWATAGGARALGVTDRIGHLRVGAEADVVVVGGERRRALTDDDAVTSLVYSGSSSEVTHVIVAGSLRIQNGRPVAVNGCADPE